MKRTLCVIIVVTMLLSIYPTANASWFSKDKDPQLTDAQIAFNTSNEAYDNINAAYIIVEAFAEDVYDAWKCGIYDDDEDDFGLSYLAKEIGLPIEDMRQGFAYYINSEEWDDLTEEERKEKIDSAETWFSLYALLSDSAFSTCVFAVIGTYQVTGKATEVDDCLATAKQLMRSLSEKYSDYEHYPSLKGFYTTTSAFYDFCKNPSGSFQQLTTTINDYRNTARRYKNDVAFIFED